MKNKITLIFLIFLSISGQAQEKIENPENIVNIKAIPYRLQNKNWVKVDMEKDPLRISEEVRVQFEIEMKDGKKLYTKVEDQGTVKFKEIKYKSSGVASPGLLQKALIGDELLNISNWEFNLNHDGRLSVIINAYHKKNKDKIYKTVWPVSPPAGDPVTIWYSAVVHDFKNGVDIKVRTSVQQGEDGKTYLRLDVKPIGDWEKWGEKSWREDSYYLIDVSSEKVLIKTDGQAGKGPGDQSSYKTTGDRGYDGGKGGDITLYISEEAAKYADILFTSTNGGDGGPGGQGSISYGPRGKRGTKGRVKIIEE